MERKKDVCHPVVQNVSFAGSYGGFWVPVLFSFSDYLDLGDFSPTGKSKRFRRISSGNYSFTKRNAWFGTIVLPKKFNVSTELKRTYPIGNLPDL